MKTPVLAPLLCGATLLASSARAQTAEKPATSEMARLAKALSGDWNTEEVVQLGKPVPKGAGRRGRTHVRLAGGGTVLVSEGHSVGAVGGDLRWLITVWWEPEAKRYRFLTCFGAPDGSGCELRGTGRWEGDVFVNDYEGVIDGKKVRLQDRWTDIQPNSHTLSEVYDSGNGVMTPYVVSHDTRR